MDWKHGYFADGGYTFGFYPETIPWRLAWVGLLRGALAPLERFRYLDLGCGQGYSLILMAAHYPQAEFVGIDFMPEHIAHARELAARAGITNVRFIEGDFLALSQSPEILGEFDYAVAHGITTWIAPTVREALFSLAAQVLRPGGLMYNSYNTYPGWLSANPFQHLVIQLQSRYNGMQALEIARKSMDSLKQANSNLFRLLPNLNERLEGMQKQDPAYLVQEYNNLYWQPVYCSEMLQQARQHKLEFLGSATLPELFDNCYPPALLSLMNTESDPILRETVRDLGVSQSFRRDVYVKGPNKLWPAAQRRVILDQILVQTGLVALPASDEKFKFTGSVTIEGDREQYLRLLEAFGSGGKTIRDVLAALPDFDLGRVLQMSSLLIHGNWLAPGSNSDTTLPRALNRVILQSILDGAPYRHVSLGGAQTALPFSDSELVLLALLDQEPKLKDSDVIAEKLHTTMLGLNRRFAENGKAIEDKSKSLAKAKKITADFMNKGLPLCRAAGII